MHSLATRDRPPGDTGIGIGWYAAALVVYVAGGFFLKSVLLNWLVGPLFLLIVLYLVPAFARRLVARLRTEPVE